jgi:hypothetical protein
MCQDLDLLAVITRITAYPIISSAHTDGPTTWLLTCSQADLQTLQQALRASVLTLGSTVTAAPVELWDNEPDSGAAAGEPNRCAGGGNMDNTLQRITEWMIEELEERGYIVIGRWSMVDQTWYAEIRGSKGDVVAGESSHGSASVAEALEHLWREIAV